ncbi:MAG: autotransporter domain-containing protein [Methylacidiphilales bacterium]|nr:autotransporter domain-containing protein [Candidatus Methylacidiphilales bacterium]
MKHFWGSVIVFIAITSFAPLALGSPDWTNTGPDDDFNNGANWTTSTSTGVVPGPTDSAHIFPGFTTIADPSASNITVRQGGSNDITINSTTDQNVESLLISSNFDTFPSTNGTLNLNFQNGSTLSIGDGAVITGTSTVNFTGNLQIVSGGFGFSVGTDESTIDSGQVTGAGTLNLSSGTVNFDSQLSTLLIGDGVAGAVTQGNNSTVIGSGIFIGTVSGSTQAAGTGTYALTGNSVLDMGTPGNPQASSYSISVGEGNGSSGTLTISDTSSLNAANANTSFLIGDNKGTGIVTQSGNTTVTLGGNNSNLYIGNLGGTGTYNFVSGNLSISNFNTIIGNGANSTGTFNQSGGNLISTSSGFVVGDSGTGTYLLSGGTADFQNGLTVGEGAGSVGTFTQNGGALTIENQLFDIGATSGTGTYNLEGGTATLNIGGFVGATGSIDQTGGTLVVSLGQAIDLSTLGSSYTLAGGILQIGNDGVTNGLTGTTGEGTFNFAGGTLQVSPGSSDFTDGLDGAVTGNSTIDTTNANVILSGALTGNGTLTVTGGNTVSLTGDSHTAGWGINVVNGAVNADASTFPSSGNITLGSGGAGATGILNLTVGSGANPLIGNLTTTGLQGTAVLNANFSSSTDTLELGGTPQFNGTINLNGGGTLKIFNGTFGTITDGGSNSNVEIGGDNNVAQTGTVTLAGPNNYGGLTTVNNNFTLIASNLPGSGGVTNFGSLSTGLTPSTLPTTGNTTFTVGAATLSESNTPTMTIGGALNSSNTIMVNSNGTTSDLYLVNPAAGPSTISGTVTVHGVGIVTNQVIVDAQGGLVAGAVTANVDGAHVLFNGTIEQIGDYLVLNTTQIGTSSFARTPNQRAVAAVIDPILTSSNPPAGFTRLGVVFNDLTAAEIPGALDQTSPQSLQYSRDIAFENATFLAQRVNGALADLRAGYRGFDTTGLSVIDPVMNSGLGRSLGSLLALNSHQPAPNGVNYYPDDSSGPGPMSESPISSGTMSDSDNPLMVPSTHPASDKYVPPSSQYNGPGFSEFISGDIILADLNQNQSASNAPSSKASYTAGDATAGIAFRMTSNLSAGILFDYNHTDAKTDSAGSKTKVDSYTPGFYATFYDHGFYINGLAAFGWNSYSNDRTTILGDTAHSSPSGQQYIGNLDFGYDFYPDRHWTLGPTLGLTYTHLDVDSFTETGSPGADLLVHSQSADSLRSRLGGHVAYTTHSGSILFQPNFSLMWQHEYLDDSSGITSQFADFSSAPLTINTAAPSRDSALIGLGVTATLDNSLSFYLNYIADVGAGDYYAQSVIGGLKARF